MKLTVQTFLTLDGVMQAPGGPEEDPSDAFTHGGWQAPFLDPAVGEFVTELNSHASAWQVGSTLTHHFDGHGIDPLPGVVVEWDPPRRSASRGVRTPSEGPPAGFGTLAT